MSATRLGPVSQRLAYPLTYRREIDYPAGIAQSLQVFYRV